MAVTAIYELTVFDSDDVAELFDVSTDPAHARPYLKAPNNFPEQELDFAKGAASIGQMNLEVVDVRTDATDQNTGYFTGQLATAGGFSALNGHRALVTEDLGGGPVTILDGVIKGVKLLDSFVTYALELRDIRERERKAKAFATTSTPTILPRGVLDGYGVQLFGSFRFPVSPTAPLTAVYRQDAATYGEFELTENASQRPELKFTEPMREAFESFAPIDDSPEVRVFDRWKVLWRDTAGGGAYTELTRIAHTHASLPGGGGALPYTAGGGVILGVKVDNLVDSGTLPSNGQAVDLVVQYDGPVTSDWAFHLQDLTVGELLRNLYRGDYSAEDPRIRYNEAALLLLTTPVRLRVTEPIEDLREWTEKNCYPIAHAVPVLNAAGEIAPITYLLPDSTVTAVTIDNTNARPAGAGWSHGTQDAINLVKVTYFRDFLVPPPDDASDLQALSDQVHTRTVEEEHRIQDSIDLLGEQPLEIESELLRSVGTVDGGPIFGDVTDETGSQVASRITRMATDRFALGAQYFDLLGDRADSDIEALLPGTWCEVDVSWMPDYESGERGLARLAQVVSRKTRDGAWTALGFIDAGSVAAAFAVPTLGTVTADAAGVVSIPVTAIVADSECRVDYAVNASEPAAGSELWRFLGPRVTSTPTTLTTPPTPPNVNVWVRARSEAVGRRPSAYTTAVSVSTASTPRVVKVKLLLNQAEGLPTDTNPPTVTWTPNTLCLGVRILYEVHLLATVPSFGDSIDADSADLTAELTDVVVPDGWVLSVRVVPYPGWSDPNVTGSPGPLVEVSSASNTPGDNPAREGKYVFRLVPAMSGTDRIHTVVMSYDLDTSSGKILTTVAYTIPGPTGIIGQTLEILSGSGRHTLQASAADIEIPDDAFDIVVTASAWNTARAAYETAATVFYPDLTDAVEGTRVYDGTNEYLSRRVRFGAGLTLALNAGEPELTVSSGDGSFSGLSDTTLTAPGNGDIAIHDGADWKNRILAASDIPNLNTSKLTAGELGVARGGTGLGTLTSEGVLVGNTASLRFATIGTLNQVLAVNGAGAWEAATLTAAHVPNHDDLTGFDSDEHVAHASVSITGTGNLGGGGTIAASRTITMDAAISLTSVSCSGDVTSNTSDRRLKDAYRDLGGPEALAMVNRWRAFRYHWNELARELGLHETDGDRPKVGLFAQEVQLELPEAVAPAPFDTDKDTLESFSGERYLTVRYERTVPVLVAAIQELTVRLEELE